MAGVNEKNENVKHPKHYAGSTSIECIESMLISFGPEYTMAYCLINAYKYIWRYKNKNGIEDLNKAKQYIEFYDDIKEKSGRYVLWDKYEMIKSILNNKLEEGKNE